MADYINTFLLKTPTLTTPTLNKTAETAYTPRLTTIATQSPLIKTQATIPTATKTLDRSLFLQQATAVSQSETAVAPTSKPALVQPAITAPSETASEASSLPAMSQTADEQTAFLVDEAKTQDPVSMIIPSTPKVSVAPEASTTAIRTYTAVSSYGTPTATQAQAEEAVYSEARPAAVVTESQAMPADMEASAFRIREVAPKPPTIPGPYQTNMTAVDLARKAAESVEVSPAAQNVVTQQAIQNPVTVVSAMKSSDQEYKQGQIGTQYFQDSLEVGAPAATMPQQPSYQEYIEIPEAKSLMDTAKKYAPYIAVGAIALLLLKRS